VREAYQNEPANNGPAPSDPQIWSSLFQCAAMVETVFFGPMAERNVATASMVATAKTITVGREARRDRRRSSGSGERSRGRVGLQMGWMVGDDVWGSDGRYNFLPCPRDGLSFLAFDGIFLMMTMRFRLEAGFEAADKKLRGNSLLGYIVRDGRQETTRNTHLGWLHDAPSHSPR
jgi:hypothetical protein